MKKILLIEDDIHLQSLLKTLFERHEIHCDAVFDGEDAFEAFSKEPYDLVVTDIHLPDMSGGDILKKMREHNADLPVIAITGGDRRGDSDVDVLRQVEKLGVSGLFKKPFDHSALLDLVNKELKNQGRGFLKFVD